jgi:hypothetical protein
LRITTHSHRFVFLEDTEGIETYYALPGHEIDESDIVRISPGLAPSAEGDSARSSPVSGAVV